ncbi:MAG TPA: hypothetical protein VED37_09100 [Ktedonobacteraceae bacterium]|nr:hypothetical protein [Ktedonobacteraceae bacterium]
MTIPKRRQTLRSLLRLLVTSLAAWARGELAEDGADLSIVLHW